MRSWMRDWRLLLLWGCFCLVFTAVPLSRGDGFQAVVGIIGSLAYLGLAGVQYLGGRRRERRSRRAYWRRRARQARVNRR